MKLYHYTKFETFVSYILPELQLRFNPFSGCNDPFEFFISCEFGINSFTIKYYQEFANEYTKQLNEYRFICFSKDKDRRKSNGFKLPTMWAHYGQNHNGICIELDSNKLDYSRFKRDAIKRKSVRYSRKNSIGTINSHFPQKHINETIEEYIHRGILNCVKAWESSSLFTKLPDWRIENEYRVVHKSADQKDEYLDISNAITAVYLGVRASNKKNESQKLKILELLIDEKNKDRKEKIELNILYNEVTDGENKLDFYIWKNYQRASNNNKLMVKGEAKK